MGDTQGTRQGDGPEDTYDRAVSVIESLEFRVETEKRIARNAWMLVSLRRWLMILVMLVGLNWMHDLATATEVFDWWDGRTEGFLSSETEHEITTLTPLLVAVLPIALGFFLDRRDKRRRPEGD